MSRNPKREPLFEWTKSKWSVNVGLLINSTFLSVLCIYVCECGFLCRCFTSQHMKTQRCFLLAQSTTKHESVEKQPTQRRIQKWHVCRWLFLCVWLFVCRSFLLLFLPECSLNRGHFYIPALIVSNFLFLSFSFSSLPSPRRDSCLLTLDWRARDTPLYIFTAQ